MSLFLLLPGSSTDGAEPPAEAVEGMLRCEMQYTPGVWTINADVGGPNDITFRRGLGGNGPNDRVSVPGLASFDLYNDNGEYSPNHTNVTPGFLEGTPVRFVCTYQGEDFILWTGELAGITPEPGVRSRVTHCQAVTSITKLLEAKIAAIAPNLNQTEVDLLTAVIAAIPVDLRPPSVVFDDAQDSFTFAFWNLEAGKLALSVINDLMQSARGYAVELRDGTLAYKNFLSRALALSKFAFTDTTLSQLDRPTERARAFKRVRVTTRPQLVGETDDEVLCSHQGTLVLQPGESVTFFLDYQDQTNHQQKLSGSEFFNGGVLVPGTDIVFNAAANGSGADLTAAITVTTDPFVGSCKFTLTNTGGSAAYKQVLQLRGRAVRNLTPAVSEVEATSSTGLGTLEIDLVFQDDAVVGFQEASYQAAQYGDLSKQIDAVEFLANISADLFGLAMTLEVGDAVTISETRTGTVQVDGYVQWLEFRATTAGLLHVRCGLAPRIERQQSRHENLVVSDVLVEEASGPESRIDVAEIDFSEIFG